MMIRMMNKKIFTWTFVYLSSIKGSLFSVLQLRMQGAVGLGDTVKVVGRPELGTGIVRFHGKVKVSPHR